MKIIQIILAFLICANCANAQPVCNGVLGAPILNLTFGQGNATQSAYSPLATYAPGLSTNTTLSTSGSLYAADVSGLVKNGSVFGSAPSWLATTDHTGNPYGLFMGINMPDAIGDTVVEYLMTGLCPNTTLQYSIWLVNLMAPTHPMVIAGSPLIEYPNMIMRILDASNNIIGTFNTGDVPTDGLWHQYAYLFNNGNSSTVKLQLINSKAGSNYGNDVALDDITIKPCVPNADIFPKFDTTFCKTTSLTFTASLTSNVYNPANYQWQYSSNSGGTWNDIGTATTNNTLNFTFSTANAPTQYWIRYLASASNVVNSTNCHATSDTSIIRIDTIGNVHLPADTTICSNISLNLSANAPYATNYVWNTGATTNNINVNTTGNYWVRAVSLYGCKSSDTILVNSISVNNPNLGNDTSFCIGAVYNLNASYVNANNYLWSTGATSSNIQVTTSGNYWVKAFFGNCMGSDTVHVDFNPTPIVNLGNDTSICNGNSYTINGNTANVTSYLWSTGATTPTIQVINPGLYWVKAFYLNCFSSDSITISFRENPVPNLGPDTAFCIGMQYDLDASDVNADSYLWSTGAATPIIQVTTSGDYWVKAIFGDCTTSDSVHVNFNEYPIVDLGEDTVICEGASIVVNNSESYPDGVYNWNNNPNYNESSFLVHEAGKYWLTITNAPNCTGMDTVEIKTIKCECNFMVPNAFSPNADAVNDLFLPRLITEGCPMIHYSFYIYNRWGQSVFFTTDFHKGWDGYVRTKPADVGTYMYFIRVTDKISGETRTYKGDLALIR